MEFQVNEIRNAIAALPALQQPQWGDHPELPAVLRELENSAPLITAADTGELAGRLAEAAAGRIQVVQAGDCAEDLAESNPYDVARKAGLLEVLAGTMAMASGRPVLRVGRLAGQYGKPRSRPTETVNGQELPVYRGPAVNSAEPDPVLRQPDPALLLHAHRAARRVVDALGWDRPPAERHRISAPVWTSHEALLLDYELPLLRRQSDGSLLLGSAHWPWIGERTRQIDGPHVALLSLVSNPVACKVGPGMTPAELLALCARLDPRRSPGRLTLIARMGAGTAAARLPALVRAVRAAGHPVLWLCDPMHGNTVSGPDGLKTRLVGTVVREVEEFQEAVPAAGGTAAGLHLETTPDEVTECVWGSQDISVAKTKYTSLCDPRLNPAQAAAVAAAWRS